MRIAVPQLRRVVRRLVNEQMEEISLPIYFTNSNGEEIDWSDIMFDIEEEITSSEIRPSKKSDVNLKRVVRAAKAVGYPNLPLHFLQEIAEKLTDLAHDMY